MTALALTLALALGSPVPRTAPMTIVRGADGLGKLIASAGDRPLVLHFFATWCPECVKELPTIAKTLEAAQAKGARVVLVSLDEEKDGAKKADRLLDRLRVPGERCLLEAPDPEPIAALIDRAWDGGLPATFVYRKSKRAFAVVGALDRPEALLAALAR